MTIASKYVIAAGILFLSLARLAEATLAATLKEIKQLPSDAINASCHFALDKAAGGLLLLSARAAKNGETEKSSADMNDAYKVMYRSTAFYFTLVEPPPHLYEEAKARIGKTVTPEIVNYCLDRANENLKDNLAWTQQAPAIRQRALARLNSLFKFIQSHPQQFGLE